MDLGSYAPCIPFRGASAAGQPPPSPRDGFMRLPGRGYRAHSLVGSFTLRYIGPPAEAFHELFAPAHAIGRPARAQRGLGTGCPLDRRTAGADRNPGRGPAHRGPDPRMGAEGLFVGIPAPLERGRGLRKRRLRPRDQRHRSRPRDYRHGRPPVEARRDLQFLVRTRGGAALPQRLGQGIRRIPVAPGRTHAGRHSLFRLPGAREDLLGVHQGPGSGFHRRTAGQGVLVLHPQRRLRYQRLLLPRRGRAGLALRIQRDRLPAGSGGLGIADAGRSLRARGRPAPREAAARLEPGLPP